ncbi:MAG: helix-turn-helix transcriptional regulator [Bacteroidaceae bacterium]|jgi:hypothetical protein
MASNLLGRYVWLVDILRRYKRLTFQEINELWLDSGLNYGEELPLRTFHNHRKAIEEIFDIYIDCDKKDGYRYYIVNPKQLEGDNFRSWLVSSYATLNQVLADRKLENRILFENIPSGQIWLTTISDAMRHNWTLRITYQGFGKSEPTTFEIEPYCLKVVKRRWYVVGRSPYYSEKNAATGSQIKEILVYALDRILDLQETQKSFVMKEDFDADLYFKGCCGVITSDEPSQTIVLQAYGEFVNYLRTLPLHDSQTELSCDDQSALFEYHIKPTFDFYQWLLAQGDQVKVLKPQSVRDVMHSYAKTLLEYYEDTEEMA